MIFRFQAPSISEALQLARAEIGPDCVVVEVTRDQGSALVAVEGELPRGGAAPGGSWGGAPAATALAPPPRQTQLGALRAERGAAAEAACPLERQLRLRGLRSERITALLRGLLPNRDPAWRMRQLERRLALLVPSAEAQATPRTLALVGPTGAGKTTTIAKLAAQAKLDRGLEVGFVTIDLFRVAAVDQLAAYANLLDAPIETASNPQELVAALRRLRGCQQVFVDTAGQSPLDEARLAELAAFFAAAPEVEAALVLPATAQQRQLEVALERFSACPLASLIVSKLDEAVSAGDLLELLAQAPVGLRWLTTGQRVPEDIEDARPHPLARWILTGRLA